MSSCCLAVCMMPWPHSLLETMAGVTVMLKAMHVTTTKHCFFGRTNAIPRVDGKAGD